MAAASESPPGLAVPSASHPRLRLWFLGTAGLWFAALAGILIYALGGWAEIAQVLDVLINNDHYDVSRGAFIDSFFANQYDDASSASAG
jgi:hypothetical protein